MREIKFRYWDKGEGRRVLFALNQLDEDHIIPGGAYLDQVEVMQYTGLKDKGGRDIYEGDVVKIDGGAEPINVPVFFADGCFCIRAPWISDNPHPELKWYVGMEFCSIEVIGNIYENPGLLSPTQGA